MKSMLELERAHDRQLSLDTHAHENLGLAASALWKHS